MGTVDLQVMDSVRELAAVANDSDEPLVVFDGDDECLVAMRPAVFERILFDSDLLNAAGRKALRF